MSISGLHLKEAKHGHAIYCDAADSGPLREDSADNMNLGYYEAMGTGGDRFSGREGAGGGGRAGVEVKRRGGAGEDEDKELMSEDIM